MRLRKLVRGLAIALAAAAFVASGAFLWLRASGRAQRSGSAPIDGLAASVEVRFDRYGIPSVAAGSARDAAAALGWLHANDRLFQMELTRRAAGGRLAELFGERALGFDRRIRALGFPGATERLLAAAAPETRELLDAYAAGVNAWIAARGGDLPPEYRILRRRPEPWRPIDSIAVIFVMARTLSPVTEPPEDDFFRFLRAFGPERARELAGDADATIFAEVEELARATQAPADELGGRAEGEGLGSNNWAVGPARSAAGHALVANDPHLGLGLPNVWYPAGFDAPDYRAVGMTLPGAPGVVLGRGERVAWACTNLYVDDVDVFLERLDETGTKVWREGGWTPITIERDRIQVGIGAEAREVDVEVRSTDRGVLVEADPEAGLPARSVAWVGWQPGDQLAAFLALARARSVEDVPAAVAGYVFPAQNLVAGDAEGRLLWTPLGLSPRRRGWDGRFPAPAWRADVGWDGTVPAAENPVLRDPAGGLIATANSFLPTEQPAWFEGDFDTPFRMDRIREALAERSAWDVESLLALQGDVVSLWARELSGRLDSDLPGDAGRAVAALRAWDGAMAERGASALFALVERELQRAIFEDEAERAGLPRFGTRWRLRRLLAGEMSPAWFDDVRTAATEDRRAVLARALEAAWRDGVARWGEEVAGWRYAEIHTLKLDHPLGSVPLLGRWFEIAPIPLPGSATTVFALHGPWRDGRMDISYGPSMRFVTDAADPAATLAVIPAGVAGHPADPHYADQLPLYLDGRAIRLPWGREAAAREAASTLVLEPVAR
jgi:penicillin amidase